MDFKGKLKQCWWDISGGVLEVTFYLSDSAEIREFMSKVKQSDDLKITLRKWREKRSNDANAYFHVICTDIATVMTLSGSVMSMTEVKNGLIADYGQPEYINGLQQLTLESGLEPSEALKLKEMHWRYDGITADGTYRYTIMRGSHTYDTREMAALIEGAIQLAKDNGLDVMPPEERERLLALWQPA